MIQKRKLNKKRNLRKKPCFFCNESINYVDYKNIETLQKYINSHGKILSSRINGNCSRHQRCLSVAIKRARIMALIPFVAPRIRK